MSNYISREISNNYVDAPDIRFMVSLIRHIDHEAFKHLLSCLFASTFALKAVSSTDLIRELFNVLSPSNPSFYITVNLFAQSKATQWIQVMVIKDMMAI